MSVSHMCLEQLRKCNSWVELSWFMSFNLNDHVWLVITMLDRAGYSSHSEGPIAFCEPICKLVSRHEPHIRLFRTLLETLCVWLTQKTFGIRISLVVYGKPWYINKCVYPNKMIPEPPPPQHTHRGHGEQRLWTQTELTFHPNLTEPEQFWFCDHGQDTESTSFFASSSAKMELQRPIHWSVVIIK